AVAMSRGANVAVAAPFAAVVTVRMTVDRSGFVSVKSTEAPDTAPAGASVRVSVDCTVTPPGSLARTAGGTVGFDSAVGARSTARGRASVSISGRPFPFASRGALDGPQGAATVEAAPPAYATA